MVYQPSFVYCYGWKVIKCKKNKDEVEKNTLKFY